MHKAGLSGGAHRGSSDLFKNRSANGELSHLQRHEDDAFNVPNEDLPGHIECTACAAFYNVPVLLPGVAFTEMISSGSVFMRAERNCKVSRQLAMKRSVSMLVKKPARSWLVYSWSGERIKVSVLEELDEIKYITPGQVVGKRLR